MGARSPLRKNINVNLVSWKTFLLNFLSENFDTTKRLLVLHYILKHFISIITHYFSAKMKSKLDKKRKQIKKHQDKINKSSMATFHQEHNASIFRQ